MGAHFKIYNVHLKLEVFNDRLTEKNLPDHIEDLLTNPDMRLGSNVYVEYKSQYTYADEEPLEPWSRHHRGKNCPVCETEECTLNILG